MVLNGFEQWKITYENVQYFLEDKLPWGFVPEKKNNYVYNANLRNSTKKKVRDSIELIKSMLNIYK